MSLNSSESRVDVQIYSREVSPFMQVKVELSIIKKFGPVLMDGAPKLVKLLRAHGGCLGSRTDEGRGYLR